MAELQTFSDKTKDLRFFLDKAVENQKGKEFSYLLADAVRVMDGFLKEGVSAVQVANLNALASALDGVVEKQRAGASSFLFAQARDWLKEVKELQNSSYAAADAAQQMLVGLGYVFSEGQWVLPVQGKGLLPCPFCGDEAEETCGANEKGCQYAISCNNPRCPIDCCATAWHDSSEDAVKTWNQRSKDLAVKVDKDHVMVPRYALGLGSVADFAATYDFENVGNSHYDAFEEFWAELVERVVACEKKNKNKGG